MAGVLGQVADLHGGDVGRLVDSARADLGVRAEELETVAQRSCHSAQWSARRG